MSRRRSARKFTGKLNSPLVWRISSRRPPIGPTSTSDEKAEAQLLFAELKERVDLLFGALRNFNQGRRSIPDARPSVSGAVCAGISD